MYTAKTHNVVCLQLKKMMSNYILHWRLMDQYLEQLADPETILSCSSDCLGLGFSAATSIPYLECSNDVPACCQHPQMVQRVNNCLLLYPIPGDMNHVGYTSVQVLMATYWFQVTPHNWYYNHRRRNTFFSGGAILPKSGVSGYADKGGIVPDDIRLVSCSQLVRRGRQRKKSRTPRGEISWNQVEIMRIQSRFLWNQARKSAQPSSPTHFYNIWRNFWGKSQGNQREIRKSRTLKLLIADTSASPRVLVQCPQSI